MSTKKTEIFQDNPNTGEFKQCANGHYYQGTTCPYCKENKTKVQGNNPIGDNKTVPHGETPPQAPTIDIDYGQPAKADNPNNTIIDELEDNNFSNANSVVDIRRSSRKLVGWLVTYSNNPLGIDYKLFEGRNIIGRDMECNVSVNDRRVSAKHAVLLYRHGKYSITDTQSSNGTFVNDEDIELEPRYINDGDEICIGDTVFKFRTSL